VAFSDPYTKSAGAFTDAPSWACVSGESNPPTFTVNQGTAAYGVGGTQKCVLGTFSWTGSGSVPYIQWPSYRAAASPSAVPDYTVAFYLARSQPGTASAVSANGAGFSWEYGCSAPSFGQMSGAYHLELTGSGLTLFDAGHTTMANIGVSAPDWAKVSVVVSGGQIVVSMTLAGSSTTYSMSTPYVGSYKAIQPLLAPRMGNTSGLAAAFLTQMSVTYRA
jgi:hypothetical protein